MECDGLPSLCYRRIAESVARNKRRQAVALQSCSFIISKMNLFQAISRNDPLAIAILHGKRSISYGELRDETLRTAGLLKRFGVAPGDRVALLLHDSPEFVEAFIAICSMGAIAVPINMALRLEDQRAILNNSDARFALV